MSEAVEKLGSGREGDRPGGRDGAPAEAHMLYGLQDIRMRRQFIEDEDAGLDRKYREHKRLDALLAYCEAPACRRAALLEYFGERIEALRQLRCLPRPVGAHRWHGGCPKNPVGGLPIRGTLRRGARDRLPAGGGDGGDRAFRASS